MSQRAPKQRPPRVFAGRDYRAWRRSIIRLLIDFIDPAVMKWVKANPPRYFVADNLDWIDRAITAVKGMNAPEIWSILTDRIRNAYGFVRAFHGCRTESIEEYARLGLLPCDPSALENLASKIFSKKDRLNAAFESMAERDFDKSYKDHNRGKVFFCLEMDELVEHCGHYLLYGSEYLQCIASHIGEPEALRGRGRATVVECNVPMVDIPEEFVRCLAGEVLREIFEKYCDRSYRTCIIGFGFYIRAALKPENIVGFHFPTQIPNPKRFRLRED